MIRADFVAFLFDAHAHTNLIQMVSFLSIDSSRFYCEIEEMRIMLAEARIPLLPFIFIASCDAKCQHAFLPHARWICRKRMGGA